MKYTNLIKGVNSRIDELQAGILRVKLPYLDSLTDDRVKIAALYSKLLNGVGDIVVPFICLYLIYCPNDSSNRCR